MRLQFLSPEGRWCNKGASSQWSQQRQGGSKIISFPLKGEGQGEGEKRLSHCL